MSRGKYLSLKEARETRQIKRFCEAHPSEGDETKFNRLLDAMTKNSPATSGTSGSAPSEDCSGTQTPRGTSEDA